MAGYDTFEVATDGGGLHVGRWGDERNRTTVVAVHGITGNHKSWGTVARKLSDRGVTVVAPDLRGRGDSAAVKGPYGMATHARDVVRILDHLGRERATVVGHSMGAFVAAAAGAHHPDRVDALVLVDGGLALAGATQTTAGPDVDEVLEQTIGPAIARLRMTFASRDEYRAFWKRHPAFENEPWTRDVEAYVDHDLTGEPPELRSKVDPQAVREDGRDILQEGAGTAVTRARCPVHLLWADHGMLGERGGLYDEARLATLPSVPATRVTGTNHYSILFADHATDVVAGAVATAATARR